MFMAGKGNWSNSPLFPHQAPEHKNLDTLMGHSGRPEPGNQPAGHSRQYGPPGHQDLPVLRLQMGRRILRQEPGSYAFPILHRILKGNGDPGRSRTCDLRFRKPSLYPSELQGHRLFSTTCTKFNTFDCAIVGHRSGGRGCCSHLGKNSN